MIAGSKKYFYQSDFQRLNITRHINDLNMRGILKQEPVSEDNDGGTSAHLPLFKSLICTAVSI